MKKTIFLFIAGLLVITSCTKRESSEIPTSTTTSTPAPTKSGARVINEAFPWGGAHIVDSVADVLEAAYTGSEREMRIDLNMIRETMENNPSAVAIWLVPAEYQGQATRTFRYVNAEGADIAIDEHSAMCLHTPACSPSCKR